jgi:hypothetical protein
VVVAPLVAVLAVGDLKAMGNERMDPDGQALTLAALVIAGLITVAVYSLIGLGVLNGLF